MDNLDTVSYNERQRERSELKNIFLPNKYGLIGEATVGLIALVSFNVSSLSGQFLGEDANTSAALSLSLRPFHRLLGRLDQYAGLEQILLFVLWGMAGALIYILGFRILQIVFGVSHSLGTGWGYMRRDSHTGLVLWLASLHDFFVKALIAIVGMVSALSGALICFGIANQELHNGTATSFPRNLLLILVSLFAAALSVRLIVIGLSLTSRHFRNWYAA